MKCIKKSDNVKRVTDKKASFMVNEKGYEYCPKSEWKKGRKDGKV